MYTSRRAVIRGVNVRKWTVLSVASDGKDSSDANLPNIRQTPILDPFKGDIEFFAYVPSASDKLCAEVDNESLQLDKQRFEMEQKGREYLRKEREIEREKHRVERQEIYRLEQKKFKLMRIQK